MMVKNLQNEDLCSIGVKIADWLAQDEAVQEYCRENFGRLLTVYVAPPEAWMPREDSAPYAFIHGLAKSEGANITQAEYQCCLCIGVSVDKADNAVTGSGVIVDPGVQRTSELMSLLQDALYRYGGEDGCTPPAIVEQSVATCVGDSATHWEGFMAAVWRLPITIGGQYHF